MRLLRSPSAWLSLLVSLVPAAASAQPDPARTVGLVVHAPPGSPATRDQVGGALSRAAEGDGWRADPRPFAHSATALAAGAVPRARLERFARAEELAREGWRAYLEARPTFAISRLGDARAEAAALLDLDGGLELYADLSIRIGAARLALGRDDEADLDFRLAAALDPEREVTDAEFKPAVVVRYAAARAARPGAVRQRIDSAPGGAAIEVDGRRIGTAPVEVDLEPGLHVIVARAPGLAARAEAIATSGQPVTLELDPDPLAAAVVHGTKGMVVGRDEAAATEVAVALMVYGELDALLVTASIWRRGAPVLLGQLCRSGAPTRCGRVVEIGYQRPADLPRAAARLWRETRRAPARFPLTLLGDERLVRRELAPGQGPPVVGGGRGWWQRPWIWIGVSSVALAVAAGFLVVGDDEVEPVIVGNPCDFGGCATGR
jgi:hypothetical protein